MLFYSKNNPRKMIGFIAFFTLNAESSGDSAMFGNLRDSIAESRLIFLIS